MRVVIASLFCLLLEPVVAARRHSGTIARHTQGASVHAVQTIPAEEEKPVQECIYNYPIVLKCPETHHVEVVTAFWNRRKREDCAGVGGLLDSAGQHCNPNATDRIIDFCHGQGGNSCEIAAGTTGCEENPFTFMRIRWLCADGARDRPASDVTGAPSPASNEVIKEEDEPEQKDELEQEEEVDMGVEAAEDEEELAELPTVPKKKGDEEAQKEWKKHPAIRLLPATLTYDHCRSLRLGAWKPCERVTKEGGFTSSPVLTGDSVCRCSFLKPFKNMTCDNIFMDDPNFFYTVRKQDGPVAIFGYEGCDCHKHPKQRGWWDCDLAVREV